MILTQIYYYGDVFRQITQEPRFVHQLLKLDDFVKDQKNHLIKLLTHNVNLLYLFDHYRCLLSQIVTMLLRWPGDTWDLFPIAGFQWYDDR